MDTTSDNPQPTVPTLTEAQINELISLKAYFPYRIVFARIKDGGVEFHTAYNRRKINDSMRNGWTVYTAQ